MHSQSLTRTIQSYVSTNPEINAARVLFILDRVLRESVAQAHENTQRRLAFLTQLEELAEDGTIAVMWSGMDCDCVKYSGSMRLVMADRESVERHIDQEYASADGPCSWMLMRPSEAIKVPYQSRDLVMEAFEDGHRHVIYA